MCVFAPNYKTDDNVFGGKMKRFINDIKKYYKYTIYAAKAELKSEVAGSFLGWIWWFLEPFCFMLVYAFLCVFVFNGKEPYVLAFVFIGNTLWTFVNKCLTASVKTISSNKNIVTKVYIPKFILVVVKLLVNFFKLTVSFIIVAGLMIFYRVPLSITIIEILPILIILFVLTFGVSVILSNFGVFVEDLVNVVNILLRFAFYFSGIFYSVTTKIPAPYGNLMARFNPAAFIIEQARDVLLRGTHISIEWCVIWLTVGILLSIIGVRLVYKNENDYVKVMNG